MPKRHRHPKGPLVPWTDLSRTCWCSPVWELREGRPVLVHKEVTEETQAAAERSLVDVRKEIGARMKAARVAAGLSHKQVTVRLGRSPAFEGRLWEWEAGKTLPMLHFLAAYCQAVGVEIGEILEDIIWPIPIVGEPRGPQRRKK